MECYVWLDFMGRISAWIDSNRRVCEILTIFKPIDTHYISKKSRATVATAMVARYVADLECVVSSSCVAFDGFDARPTTIIIINFIDALDSHLLGRTFLTIKKISLTGCFISNYHTLDGWYDNNTDFLAIKMVFVYSWDRDIW